MHYLLIEIDLIKNLFKKMINIIIKDQHQILHQVHIQQLIQIHLQH
jgi:hypothetical protein